MKSKKKIREFHGIKSRNPVFIDAKVNVRSLSEGFTENTVATAQGKRGIWFLFFPDWENTGNFALTQGKNLRHRENI